MPSYTVSPLSRALALPLLLMAACGAPAAPMSPAGGGTDPGADPMMMPPSDPYSFGEAEAGVTVGPFGDFKLFRSGCGEQLWSRFIPREDFALGEQTIRDPKGRALRTQYFETPTFLNKRRTVRLISEAKDFEPGAYEIDLRVQGAAGNVVTHTIKVTLKDDLYEATGSLSFQSLRAGSPSYVTVNSKFGGDVQRVFTYDERRCLVGSATLLSAAKLVKDQASEVQVGGALQEGTKYHFVMQGVNAVTRYTYYATVETP